ncbi:MAG: hypothetical protein HY319_24360 [Armatimonadetes bacterium]|nr:hypothetical protein [Armatimonadota bacterium]
MFRRRSLAEERDIFDRQLALSRLDHVEDALLEAAGTFLDEMPDMRCRLTTASASGEPAVLARAVHYVKSAVLLLGSRAAERAALAAGEACRQARFADLEKASRDLELQLDLLERRIIEEFPALRRNAPGSDGG